MSDIADLIAELRRRDIVIALKDDRLVVNAPKGALTPDLQERLRAAKPQLLAYLAGGGSGSADVAPRPVPRDALLPASFGQERLWLVDRWHPGSPGYLISSVIPCTLALDAGRLRAALATLVARHEALRTTLIEAPAAAACAVAQVVRPAQAVELVERDLRSLGDAAETAAEAAIGAEAATAMDLRRGPLLYCLEQVDNPRTDVSYAAAMAVDGSPMVFYEDLFVNYGAERFKANPVSHPTRDFVKNLLQEMRREGTITKAKGERTNAVWVLSKPAEGPEN